MTKKLIEDEKYPRFKQANTAMDLNNSALYPNRLPSNINELVIDEDTTNKTIAIISAYR